MDPANTNRRALPLLLGLVPALALGAYLALHRPGAAATPTPAVPRIAATSAATAIPTATTLVPAQTLVASPTLVVARGGGMPGASPTIVAGISSTGAPTLAPTTPAPTATPAPAWVEVGRWADSQILYTAPFTVRGPWRIRWRLSGSTQVFQLMIEEDGQTPILLTADTGATAGVFEEARGGTFNLMLHNTIPYEVVVEELRPTP